MRGWRRGPYELRSGVMPAEQRDPTVCNFFGNMEGKGEMIKAPISLQDLRRRIYIKAKADSAGRGGVDAGSIVSHMKCYMDWYLKIIGLAPSGIERLISCGLQRFSITL